MNIYLRVQKLYISGFVLYLKDSYDIDLPTPKYINLISLAINIFVLKVAISLSIVACATLICE